ncbi:unnamed protein product [Blepharisma stoltei]|uniref:Uncharacterized protein n=1 Tax=Blepharisma stoltei TaxID=1481888 RepID=A0AAU9JYM7_9CILI|nr:unnamed protein product [Blepharisma stoltei]
MKIYVDNKYIKFIGNYGFLIKMNNLSPNVYSVIFSFLDHKDIARASLSCKNAYRGSMMELIWRELCLRKWSFCRISKSLNSWRALFIRRITTDEGMLRGTPQDYAMAPCRGHIGYITSTIILGDFIVSGSVDGEIILWSPENPQTYKLNNIGRLEASITFLTHNDQLLLAGTNTGEFSVWSLGSELPREITRGRLKLEQMTSIGLFDNNQIFAGGNRYGNGKIIGIDAFNQVTLAEIGFELFLPGAPLTANIVKSGNFIYFGIRNTVYQLDLKTNIRRETHLGQQSVLKLSLENNKIIVNTNEGVYLMTLTLMIINYYPINQPAQNRYIFYPQNFGDNYLSTVANINGTTYISVGNNSTVSLLKIDKNNQIVLVSKVEEKGKHFNSVSCNNFNFIAASNENSIYVYDSTTGKKRYVLLGGSANPRLVPKSFVANTSKTGCVQAFIDEVKIVGVFGNMLRVYNFDL